MCGCMVWDFGLAGVCIPRPEALNPKPYLSRHCSNACRGKAPIANPFIEVQRFRVKTFDLLKGPGSWVQAFVNLKGPCTQIVCTLGAMYLCREYFKAKVYIIWVHGPINPKP